MLRPAPPRRRPFLLLGGLALACWLALLALALSTYRTPGAAELAAAHHRVAEYVAGIDAQRAACFADPDRPPDLAPGEGCGLPVRAEDVALDPYIVAEPYEFGRDAPDAVFWAAVVTGALGLLAGLRRSTTRFAAVVAGAAGFAVVGQVVAVGSAAFLHAVAGPADEWPEPWDLPVWDRLLPAAGRAVVLTVLLALLGVGVGRLARGRLLVAGGALAGWLGVETALWLLAPVATPWTPGGGVLSLLEEFGLFIPDHSRPEGPADTVHGFESGHLQATLVLAGWTAGLLLTAVVAARSGARRVPDERADSGSA
ncbi:hypothetical protein [Petropleomorpha daqingensis]|uniref:Uncharacterized protein n=1 Tax=Petropleomorpha daqingensis TaxID=2026353 RepID=A0A853CKI4_9ACTN|nr:hypothetical protein [Petropleomorpha daqingensis]NYJ07876.1 hypothetical protein [Petropleomorpha daqingensis]